jgi:general secretion pathway protein I
MDEWKGPFGALFSLTIADFSYARIQRHPTEIKRTVSLGRKEGNTMRQTRAQGFSLLETLAAMFLLALCFGALMQAAGASMALNARAADYTQASLWASGLLDRQYVTEFPAAGMHEGTFDDTYRWKMTVSEPPDAGMIQTSIPMRLYRIELTVAWSEKGKDASARFVTQRVVSDPPLHDPPPPARNMPGGDS